MMKSLITQICIFRLLEILTNCRMISLMQVGNWDLPEGNQGHICLKEVTNTAPRFAAKSWSTNWIFLFLFNIKVCFLGKKNYIVSIFPALSNHNPFSNWNIFLRRKRDMVIVRHIYFFDKIVCLTLNMGENCSVWTI